uniref:Protein scylla n=1 Tax=Musca domestica TaxID=7370 RepID=T1PEM8_MUSDO
MEVLTVQNQFADQHYGDITATRIRNWSRSLSNNAQEQQQNQQHETLQTEEEQYDCDSVDAAAVNELSQRLLTELRAAKTRNLTCTEVSLPTDLTQRIASDIVRVSEREPCGIRGCTVFVEYEEEANNLKRIAKLKLDPEMVSTFEVYLTLRQDKRGWTALLPQFIKGLSRTITISPDYSIVKRKLYSHDSN